MDSMGERVRARRNELGLSQSAVAKLAGGISYQAVQQIEAGGASKHLVAIAKALKVWPEWLQTGLGPKEAVNVVINGDPERPIDRLTHLRPLPNDGSQETYLRVLGMVEGGEDGWQLFNGEEIGSIRRPDNLIGVAGAYAVYVFGKSMEPRYQAGELVHVNPHKPVTPGSYVLVQKKPKADGDPIHAIVKRLVKRSGSRVIVAQHTPPKEFELKADEIVMHRVVGSSED